MTTERVKLHYKRLEEIVENTEFAIMLPYQQINMD